MAAHPPQAPPGEQLAVAEVLGAFPLFQTPDEVRELVLQPGTTLHRLLTDPEDGRCRERTVTAYRPDAAMRAQILAADVTCRGPGCTHPGSSCQFDHVEEHSAGGPTAETNLHLAHGSHHDEKTQRFWDAALADNRDVTWTTLLGRIYRTRSHDYRQYLTVLQDAVEQVRSVPEAERGHAIDAAVYAALSYRPPASRLRAEDDDVDLDVTFTGWDHLRLTHRDDRGMLRPGAPAEVVDLERRRTPRVDGGEGDRPRAGAGDESTVEAGGGSTEDSLVTSARTTQWDDEPPF